MTKEDRQFIAREAKWALKVFFSSVLFFSVAAVLLLALI